MLRKVIVLLLVTFIVSCSNTYLVESYKPKTVIDLDDSSLLAGRFTTLSFEGLSLHLEWFTYDNEVINKSPYKLFVVLEPLNEQVVGVDILDVSISSSKGNEYIFREGSLPFTLSNNAELKRSSVRLSPAFSFDFQGEEIIKTEIRILVKYRDKDHTFNIKHEWHPVTVKTFAPVV